MNPLPATGTPLTRVQRRVLALLADGHTKREVGARLYLTDNTVRTHVVRLRAALGARNVAHAVAIATRSGLIRPDLPAQAPRLAYRMFEVAASLGINHGTLRRWIDAGQVAAITPPGSNVVWIPADEVARLLAGRRTARPAGRSHAA